MYNAQSLGTSFRGLLSRFTAACLIAGAASAQIHLEMSADGSQSGSSSSGSASGTLTLDTAANTLDYAIHIRSLESSEVFSVFYGPGAPGTTGVGLEVLPLGNTKTGTWNYPESVEADILGGLMYVEWITIAFGGGEIRGQITLTPLAECACGVGLGPCGNDASLLPSGCNNSTGAGSRLVADGQASVGLDSLQVSATNVPPNQFGIIFMATTATQSAFGDGLFCAGGQTFRYPIASSGSSGVLSLAPGIVAYTATNFPVAGQIQSGQTWRFQAWYRDPQGPCGSGFNTSNVLAVTFTP